MDKKKILLLCTGGTIASTQGKEGLAPGLEGDDILKYIPSVKRICNILYLISSDYYVKQI